ncbi:MAG: DUF5666 domain-containing protein [Acidobacteriia bacterium]|nr:DUF5666 domain-containing protein [Terriglobia bacterium]
MPMLALLLGFEAAAQAPLPFVMGKAIAVSGDHITVHSDPDATTVLYAVPDSTIWRGQTGHSLASVQPGDNVWIQYRRDATGRLVIVDLSANLDHVWGRITRVAKGEFEVEQNFNADPQSAYRRGLREVAFDSGTQFEESAPADLRPGRTVDLIGLTITETRVHASRITVYEGNLPVRMPAGTRVTAPDGSSHIRN